MKQAILFYLLIFPVLAFAQFPVPDSFKIDVNYILMGYWDLCDGKVLEGPAYCNYFHWQAPDTANTPATLTGYRIYKDDELFLATGNTTADSAGGYLHMTFYVTAVYENPAGESEPSNSVYIDDLPMGVNDTFQAGQIGVRFDPVRQMLVIQGAEYAQALRVFDMQGCYGVLRGAKLCKTNYFDTNSPLKNACYSSLSLACPKPEPEQVADKDDLPIAMFSADRQSCIPPCTIRFSNLSKNADRYVWMVNDKIVSREKDLSFMLKKVEGHRIKLTAYKGQKSDAFEMIVRGLGE